MSYCHELTQNNSTNEQADSYPDKGENSLKKDVYYVYLCANDTSC